MTEEVTIDRETLETLRGFAENHANEYGWTVDFWDAIIESGVALDMDDPTPSTEWRYIDVGALREIDGDASVQRLKDKWESYD